MRKQKNRELIKVWVVVPHDFELKVQYCYSKDEARHMAETIFQGAAMYNETEQFKDIVEAKNTSTAKYGWRL